MYGTVVVKIVVRARGAATDELKAGTHDLGMTVWVTVSVTGRKTVVAVAEHAETLVAESKYSNTI